jgi:hypothetical protein
MGHAQDNDTYKNTVRKQIKDWHATVSQRRNQEWLILLVVRPDARATAGGLFAMRSSVLDRVKADFNSDRKDRFEHSPLPYFCMIFKVFHRNVFKDACNSSGPKAPLRLRHAPT